MWLWIRIGIILAALATGPGTYRKVHAEFENQVPSWSFVASMLGFGIFSILFLLAICNAQTEYAWSKPSWRENPLNFRQPAQFFHMGACGLTAIGLSTALYPLMLGMRNFMFVVPLSVGVGMLVGLKLAVGTFDRFENANAA
jgi:hypothetical protein